MDEGVDRRKESMQNRRVDGNKKKKMKMRKMKRRKKKMNLKKLRTAGEVNDKSGGKWQRKRERKKGRDLDQPQSIE